MGESQYVRIASSWSFFIIHVNVVIWFNKKNIVLETKSNNKSCVNDCYSD